MFNTALLTRQNVSQKMCGELNENDESTILSTEGVIDYVKKLIVNGKVTEILMKTSETHVSVGGVGTTYTVLLTHEYHPRKFKIMVELSHGRRVVSCYGSY